MGGHAGLGVEEGRHLVGIEEIWLSLEPLRCLTFYLNLSVQRTEPPQRGPSSGGNILHKGNTQLNYKDLRSEIIHTLSVTHSLSDETGPCAQSTLFDIAKPDELLEGGLDAYVLLRALERQIDRKVGVHKYEQLLDALAHLVV